MPRIDDYLNALKLARESLANEPFEIILARSGFEAADASTLCVPFLNRVYRVSGTDFAFIDAAAADRTVPLQEQILILHYLRARSAAAVPGDWVAYREIPGAAFYFGAFAKRAIDPLKKAFGRNIAGFVAAAGRLMGRPVAPGDAGFEFRVFPKVPLRLILYAGDEEFAPEANILFGRSIGGMLSPEDIAWLAGMVVYRLIGLSS
jgi:hypothetical protein